VPTFRSQEMALLRAGALRVSSQPEPRSLSPAGAGGLRVTLPESPLAQHLALGVVALSVARAHNRPHSERLHERLLASTAAGSLNRRFLHSASNDPP
jgi:hypothetical protein